MEIQQDVSLLKYNTFGAEVKARFFTEVNSISDLSKIMEEGKFNLDDIMVLGGGSNILFTKDFDGLIVKNNLSGIQKIKEDDSHIWVKIGGGENWHHFVLKSIENNWQGVENLSLIPGTVGAAPIQNIGAYGIELKDVFHELEAYMFESGNVKSFDYDDCQFGYRNSIFKNALKGKVLISSVTLRLNKVPKFNISYGAIEKELADKEVSVKNISDAVIKIRQSKLPDPEFIGNCGSFFKNPIVANRKYLQIKENYPQVPHYPVGDNKVKIPAGWLIEKCGWKGKTVGNVGTFSKQALVIINHGNGSGEEAKNLAFQIQKSVSDNFGIDLEPEVNIR